MPLPMGRVPRRAAVIGAGVVAALAIAAALVVALPRGHGSPHRAPAAVSLVTPVAEKDTVPKPRTVEEKNLATSCGVRAATLRTYVPGDHGEQGRTSCHWAADDHGRALDVQLAWAEKRTADGASVTGMAMRAVDPYSVSAVKAGRPERSVAGLGDEAYYTRSAGSDDPADRGNLVLDRYNGGKLTFRAGAAVVTIRYATGARAPERTARGGVFAVGADVARSLGVAAAPRFGDPVRPGPAPARSVPLPCEMVPSPLAARIAPHFQRGPVPGNVLAVARTGLAGSRDTYGAAVAACAWNTDPSCCANADAGKAPVRHLTVVVRSVRESRPGIGAWLTRRTFRSIYLDARDGPHRSAFERVRGLGDEAFAVFHDEGSGADEAGADVAFRYRNVIVMVSYANGDGGSQVTSGPAITAAYTAAVRARAALPG